MKTNLEKSTEKTLPFLTEKETKDRIETAVIARAIDMAKAPLLGHRTLRMSAACNKAQASFSPLQ